MESELAIVTQWLNDTRPKVDSQIASRRNRNARLESRRYTDRAKDVPCVDCGVRYPPYVMDFDHVRGVKIDDISRMVRAYVRPQRIQAEIDKCDVVCANCHRVRSHKRSLSKRVDGDV